MVFKKDNNDNLVAQINFDETPMNFNVRFEPLSLDLIYDTAKAFGIPITNDFGTEARSLYDIIKGIEIEVSKFFNEPLRWHN